MTRTLLSRTLSTATALALFLPAAALPAQAAWVGIPDPGFRQCLNDHLGQSAAAPITAAQLAGLTEVDCDRGGSPDPSVQGVQGAEHLTGATSIDLSNNSVQDLTPLAGLAGLTSLSLGQNRITDIAPLAGLTRLSRLDLANNAISDVSPLAGLSELRHALTLDGNRITDASSLARIAGEQGVHVSAAVQFHGIETTAGAPVAVPTVKDTRGRTVPPLSCAGPDGDCLDALARSGASPSFTAPDPGEYVLAYEGQGDDGYHLTLTITASDPAGSGHRFSDVPVGHTFFEEISWLSGQGITAGFADGRFGPGVKVTRGQMAAFLYRMAGQPDVDLPTRSPYTDVKSTDAFYRAIIWMSREKITTGYTNGAYGTHDTVTRAQMAAFLYRSAGSPADTPVPSISPFTDVATTASFYRSITWLNATGITTGYKDGRYGTYDAVTRGQMAAFLYRLSHLDDA